MPVYTLYLSTQITTPVSNVVVPVNKTNLANVIWNIDWDNLFRKEQYKYKHCRVRYSLVSNKWTAIGGNNDWDTYQGYLACNLPSMYNATTTNGTLLGMITPSDVYTVTSSTDHGFISSTLSDVGVDVIAPTGNSTFELKFLNTTNGYNTITPEYQIILAFELYDRKDER